MRPQVHAQDLAQGFLLLADLGTRTYLQSRRSTNAPHACSPTPSMRSMRWQLATRPGELPPYDEALLRREMQLFPDWYVGAPSRLELNDARSAPSSGSSPCW